MEKFKGGGGGVLAGCCYGQFTEQGLLYPAFCSVTDPCRSGDYASGPFGRKSQHLQDLETFRNEPATNREDGGFRVARPPGRVGALSGIPE